MNIDWNRLNAIPLLAGSHKPPSGPTEAPEGCLLEIVGWLAGEPWGDSPKCVCGVISSLGRSANDWFTDKERQGLKDIAPLMAGTVGSLALQQRRAFRCADRAVREYAPLALDAAGFKEEAAKLRALAPIVDVATAEIARNASASASASSYASWSAAASSAASWSASYASASSYASWSASASSASSAASAASYASASSSSSERAHIIESLKSLLRELCEMKEEGAC